MAANGRRSPVRDLPDDFLGWVRARRAAGWGPDRIFRARADEFKAAGVSPGNLRAAIHAGFLSGDPTQTGLPTDQLGKIAELLERSGIAPEDVGKVQAVKLSEWQSLTKNAEGEAEIHDLAGASIVLTPHWADGPAWQPVDRGPAIKLPKAAARKPEPSGMERCFLWPDTQVGYRRDLVTMELQPFHDEVAIACALACVRAVRPHKLVILGDFIDFPEFGTFEQEPGFALTVQPAIDRAALLLAEIRDATGPDCDIVFIEGNHDARLHKAIVRNAMAAFGIKRGMAPPEEWPVLSVPYLLRMDELNITYVGGYPAGIVWINENVAVIHGKRVNSSGSTALRVIDDTRVSVIFGHVHRIELLHRARQSFHGSKRSFAASVGCLCRLDGAVPSTNGSTDLFGRAVPTVENWQHATAVLHYQPGDGKFHLDIIDIQDGEAILWGKTICAKEVHQKATSPKGMGKGRSAQPA